MEKSGLELEMVFLLLIQSQKKVHNTIMVEKVKTIVEDRGALSVVDFKDFPFVPKRFFYVYDSIGTRGGHSHHKTEQMFVCFYGHCVVIVDDGKTKERHMLDSPDKMLYVPEMVWDSQVYGKGAILGVFASTLYDEKDYIYNYEEFINACSTNK